jgi:hypothetical protein
MPIELPWNYTLQCPGGTVVENFTYNPKFKGSNPTTGTGREKIVKKEYWVINTKRLFLWKNFLFLGVRGRGFVSLRDV